LKGPSTELKGPLATSDVYDT